MCSCAALGRQGVPRRLYIEATGNARRAEPRPDSSCIEADRRKHRHCRRKAIPQLSRCDRAFEAQPNIVRMTAPAMAKPTVSPAPHRTKLPISVPTFCAEN
jgi:hypothetical protein